MLIDTKHFLFFKTRVIVKSKHPSIHLEFENVVEKNVDGLCTLLQFISGIKKNNNST